MKKKWLKLKRGVVDMRPLMIASVGGGSRGSVDGDRCGGSSGGSSE